MKPVVSNGSVVVDDLDHDGDDDAFFTGTYEIQWGLAQQLAAYRRPAIARPLELEVFGTPSTPYVLFLALGRRTFSTPWGLAHLDPATLARAGGGGLDATGLGTRTLEVPDDTALVGLEVFWQAAVSAPLRPTNAERILLGAR